MTKLLSMKAVRVWTCLGGALLLTQLSFAQTDPSPVSSATPLDDFTEREIVKEHTVLAHQPVREADILWEKRLWRIIDVREKMNQPFTAPESPLFKIVSDAAMAGDLTVYSTQDDHFSQAMSPEAVRAMLYRIDTVYRPNIDTGEDEIVVVENVRDWESVHRFRIKEAWFFDSKTSTLQVRILGIAPLMDVTDENGDFKFEMPLFWVHYPSARPLLARNKAVTHGGNYAATTTWEDIFEMRYFASCVTKENNVNDLRIQDMLTGADMVMRGEQIEAELFNREHDLWAW
ncbi:MAG TPA: gliding motility protein GldN [Saprospiraceae bacterium]|nr:gliding motility protein GldN [Saprospiraceae bacterium]HPI09231.1 gliding motility protein GldN [Saprospiraceae bacterium]